MITNFENIGGVQHQAGKALIHLSTLRIRNYTFLGIKWKKKDESHESKQFCESITAVSDFTKEQLTKSKKLILSRWGQIQGLAIISTRNQFAGIVDRQALPDKKSNTLVCCKFLLNYPHNTLIAGYKYEEQIYHIIYYKMICCNLYWWLSNKKNDFGSCKRIEGRHGLASVASSSVEMVWLASILIRLAAGSWFSAAAELLQVLMLGLRWHWGQLCFVRAIHPMKKSVTITNVYHGQKLD